MRAGAQTIDVVVPEKQHRKNRSRTSSSVCSLLSRPAVASFGESVSVAWQAFLDWLIGLLSQQNSSSNSSSQDCTSSLIRAAVGCIGSRMMTPVGGCGLDNPPTVLSRVICADVWPVLSRYHQTRDVQVLGKVCCSGPHEQRRRRWRKDWSCC